ncbi:MAG TPA: AAA family ATPase [Burkholderiales bacterium]
MSALPQALLDPACYPDAMDGVELLETHISWVFLAGEYAYKVKKPVRLPFLDFGTLAARRRFCEEELRINRRTAPELYLGVVPIVSGGAGWRVDAPGEPAEYAIRMRRFPQDALADRVAKRGALGAAQVDALAAAIARFHAAIPAAPPGSLLGDPERVTGPVLANFEEITASPGDAPRLEGLRRWTRREGGRLREAFAGRKRDGFVRECHGDLHLGNIVFLGGRPLLFDGIEFSAELRWIDVMSEAAFLVMDLLEHGLDSAAWRFLNAYLESTGDYAGVRVLRYYLVYRAMVRAKVIRMRELDGAYLRYLALADFLAVSARPALVLMHGLAGSGKTTVAQALLERVGAIRVRSDVERKRLFGLEPASRTHSELYAGIYALEATQRTYERLRQVVRDVVGSGRTVIVDAASLRREDREGFAALARELDASFLIVSCRASHAELRRRVTLREVAMRDASEAGVEVLERQIATQEPIADDELPHVGAVDTEGDLRAAVDALAARLSRAEAPAAARPSTTEA